MGIMFHHGGIPTFRGRHAQEIQGVHEINERQLLFGDRARREKVKSRLQQSQSQSSQVTEETLAKPSWRLQMPSASRIGEAAACG